MADRSLAGSAPAAAAPTQPPGTLWVEVIQRGADATGKTIKVNAYCTEMIRHIGVKLGGPEQDMPGGPFIQQVFPTAWEYPPSGGSPGLVQTADMVLPDTNYYSVEVQAPQGRATLSFQAGAVDESQTGRYVDSAAAFENTPAGRQQKLRDEIRDMAKPTGIIGGAGKKMRRTQSKTTLGR